MSEPTDTYPLPPSRRIMLAEVAATEPDAYLANDSGVLVVPEPEGWPYLVADPALTLITARNEIVGALLAHTGCVDVGDPNGILRPDPDAADAPIRAAYPYEPGNFLDRWPAITCQALGFSRPPGGSDEVRFPRRLGLAVRAYYPIQDLPGVDGLKRAQDRSEAAISLWLERLWGDPHLGLRVRWADAESATARGVQDRNRLLYCWDTTVPVFLH